jgi:hypothetical protein
VSRHQTASIKRRRLKLSRVARVLSVRINALQETDMVDVSLIKEHLEVVGSDGGHVGRVDHVLGDQIELAKLDFAGGFKHHLIPVSWVERVDDKHVHLSLTQDDAKARWTEKPH